MVDKEPHDKALCKIQHSHQIRSALLDDTSMRLGVISLQHLPIYVSDESYGLCCDLWEKVCVWGGDNAPHNFVCFQGSPRDSAHHNQ